VPLLVVLGGLVTVHALVLLLPPRRSETSTAAVDLAPAVA
jgi:hypothetical protein